MNAVKVYRTGYANGMENFRRLKFHVHSMR